ncbi:MAG TPA: diaminopimelate decarboxylase [bacterium (Candidatus Stahlbacteria)]|nr:diaminopimelate decarboxylase [Candidatus Stahlbacteria bacterium]
MLKGIKRKISSLPTPCYLYDEKRIRGNIKRLKKRFSGCGADIYFAVKANTSLSVLKTISATGIGAEVVSPGEIFLSLEAGFKPSRILYNNIARIDEDVSYAIRKGVRFFNFEAVDQAELIEGCSKRHRKKTNLLVRVNPGIFPATHPHLSTGAPTSKFGIEEKELPQVIKIVKRFKFARLVGIHSHIGSQILEPEPFVKASRFVGRLIRFFKNRGIDIEYLNLGGGFGIPYHPKEKGLNLKPIAQAYERLFRKFRVKIMLEPGRSIVGDAGYILTRVISVKRRLGMPLYIIDAGMTENPRPAIYGTYHHIEPLTRRDGSRRSRVAGPLCENSDEFGIYRLPKLRIGDLLVIRDCGAYARTMVSNYNGRLLPAEYRLVDKKIKMTRRKQQLKSLIANERY